MKLGLVLAALSLAACTAEPTCVKGDARECLGLDATRCEGVQFCLEDGSGYGACECPATDSSTGSFSSSTPIGSSPTASNASGGAPNLQPAPLDTSGAGGSAPTPAPSGTQHRPNPTNPPSPDEPTPSPSSTDEPSPSPSSTDEPSPTPSSTAPSPSPSDTTPAPTNEPVEVPEPVVPKPNPVVVFMVDQSSSMFAPSASQFGSSEAFGGVVDNWEAVRVALSTLESAIAPFEVGLTSYTGEIDGQCPFIQEILVPSSSHPSMVTRVLPAADRGAPPFEGQTPTGESLNVVRQALRAMDLPGSKHIVLITDGDPDTCSHPNPQCGQDLTVSVAQAAFRDGITTHVVGITSDVGLPFLEALAYAGQGRPVPPPLSPAQQDCLARQTNSMGGNFNPNDWRASALAEYAADGASFGEKLSWTPVDEIELGVALTELLQRISTAEP